MKAKDSSRPTLYEYSVCPFCWKVKALLLYKDVPFNAVEVHPMNKKEISFSKEYRKVPIFVDQAGKQVNDSTPIMERIDELYQSTPVFEKTESEKHWIKWADEVLVKALPPLIYNTFGNSWKAFKYIGKNPKFSWIQKLYIQIAGAFFMFLVAKKKAKEYKIDDPKKHFSHCLKEWETALNGKTYHGGEKPNGADLCIFGILRSIQDLPGFEEIESHPKAKAWYNSIQNKVEKS